MFFTGKAYIAQGKELFYQNADYHPYHFVCKICSTELDENARCWKDTLYCQRCYDQKVCAICAACRRPIDNERGVFALDKHWHFDWFADACFKCGVGQTGTTLKVFQKNWCPSCYTCSVCDKILMQKSVRFIILAVFCRSKIIEMDMRPLCKKCFERFPKELKQRMLP
ncbi:unnamed protein product [Gongylonema pulchrum]|uniref:LIM zinc-binding domain-containing protein n=1 Tax=Gongylonema pulchrum TaxID=637853 RepID=A0A183D1S2_9BILA|nr:unnamed protein product [Gongylonema pulchrum]